MKSKLLRFILLISRKQVTALFFYKKDCDRQKGRFFFIAKIHIIAIDNVIFEFYNHHFAVFCD